MDIPGRGPAGHTLPMLRLPGFAPITRLISLVGRSTPGRSARYRLVALALLIACGGATTVARAETASPTTEGTAPVVGFDRGLLWRIDKATAPGRGPNPSHLYGTVHIDDPRATAFSANVLRALEQSRVFLPELRPARRHSSRPRTPPRGRRSRHWQLRTTSSASPGAWERATACPDPWPQG